MQATSRSLLRILSVSLFPIPSENHEAFPSISGDEEKAKSDTDAQKKPNDKARKVDETIALIPAFCVALTYQLRGARLELGNLHADLRSLLPASYIASLERPAARANNVPPRSGTDASIRNDLGAPKLRRRTAAAPDAAKGSTRPQAPPAPDPERTAVAYKREEAREEAAQNIDPPAALRARATPRVGARGSVVPSNVPLDLLRVLQTRLNELHDTQTQTSERDVQPKLNGPCFAHCIGLLNTLTSTMTELEQIRDTPIPLALAIHLKQVRRRSSFASWLAYLRIGRTLTLIRNSCRAASRAQRYPRPAAAAFEFGTMGSTRHGRSRIHLPRARRARGQTGRAFRPRCKSTATRSLRSRDHA